MEFGERKCSIIESEQIVFRSVCLHSSYGVESSQRKPLPKICGNMGTPRDFQHLRVCSNNWRLLTYSLDMYCAININVNLPFHHIYKNENKQFNLTQDSRNVVSSVDRIHTEHCVLDYLRNIPLSASLLEIFITKLILRSKYYRNAILSIIYMHFETSVQAMTQR